MADNLDLSDAATVSANAATSASEAVAAMLEQAQALRKDHQAIALAGTDGGAAARADLPIVQIGEAALNGASRAIDALSFPDRTGEVERLNKQLSGLMARGLSRAIERSDANSVQLWLRIAGRDPKQFEQTMGLLRESMKESAPWIKVGWEHGSDEQDQRFARVKLNVFSKTGPSTSLKLGTDGSYEAVHTSVTAGDRVTSRVSSTEALQLLMVRPNDKAR